MTSTLPRAGTTRGRLWFWRLFFVVAAIWNLVGGLPGVIAPAEMFAREFGRDLADPVLVSVYRGAWGTALLYGFGFLIVARDPIRHSGIVLMGGTGKALFALNLAVMFFKGLTSSFAIVVILGDAVFCALFVAYVIWLRRGGHRVF